VNVLVSNNAHHDTTSECRVLNVFSRVKQNKVKKEEDIKEDEKEEKKREEKV
jgi:hypothetical protein